jgi:hypothetical protein
MCYLLSRMRFCSVLKMCAAIAGVLGGAAGLCGQDASSPAAPVRAVGLPPRLSPADYQFHVQAGSVTLAAEFMGHDIPTEEGGPYFTGSYVVVEAALFGAPDAKIQLTYRDFSLRINGKKQPVPSQAYVLVFPTMKDPAWEPPAGETERALTSSAGGGANKPQFKPAPPQMPIELRHVMEQRVLKASLSEGDRTLPQAGLLFFEWHGDLKNIHSMELVYSGSPGKATLALEKP